MDGAQFAKMLSDKQLFELNRMEYKYSTVSVKEFAELLRQNFAHVFCALFFTMKLPNPRR